MEKYYTLKVAGLERQLPIIQISDHLAIASFVILGDTEIVCASAKELVKDIPECDWIITAEAKGIPFAHELTARLGKPRYIVARKSVKPYMDDPLTSVVNSITTQKEQLLCLDRVDADRIKGKRVVLADDVISTGESVEALRVLCEKAGATVVGKVCIVTEGNPDSHKDVLALGNLPLFEL